MKFFFFSNLHLVLITLLLLEPWCNAQSPGQLVRRDWGKGSTENLSLVCACCHKITIWIQLQSHIFLVYPKLAIQHPLQVSTTAEPFLTLSLHGSGHGHGWFSASPILSHFWLQLLHTAFAHPCSVVNYFFRQVDPIQLTLFLPVKVNHLGSIDSDYCTPRHNICSNVFMKGQLNCVCILCKNCKIILGSHTSRPGHYESLLVHMLFLHAFWLLSWSFQFPQKRQGKIMPPFHKN